MQGKWIGFGLAVAGLLLGGVGPAAAVPIHPTGYSFDPATGSGDYSYEDTAVPSKLTNGARGGDNWTLSPASWLGWQGISQGTAGAAAYSPVDVRIDFQFHAGTVGSVVVGTNQDAVNNWNVVLPSLVELYRVDSAGATTLLDGVYTPFALANSGLPATQNNGRRHDLTLSFNPQTLAAGEKLQLRLNNAANFAQARDTKLPIAWDNATDSTHNGMFWIFLDEVSFDSEPVPEPSTLVLLASGLLGVAAWRRGRRPH